MDGKITRMLAKGIIKSSKSQWASPVVIAPKKNAKLRLCINYIPLNFITGNDNYPLTLIPKILSSFSGAQYFTNIDLYSGYHQLLVHPESIAKTAFVMKQGQFQYRCMSFGFSGAPCTFQ